MIGLGSNRLSVCRRGGMSVTQAGKGGMEWLAGGRMPRWASPYSAQATAALKAQFPTQWPTIRDYGFSHPALVPFINEDPMLVCSLMDVGKVRWLVGDGVAYINTGYSLSNGNNLIFRVRMTRLDSSINLSGAGAAGGAFYVGTIGNKLYYAYDYYDQNSGVTADFSHDYTMCVDNINGNYYAYDNTIKQEVANINFTPASRNSNKTMMIFGYSTGGTNILNQKACKIAEVYMKKGDTELLQMYPFKRNGAMGMIDLLTGTFYGNANSSGSFTESIASPS